MTFYDHWNDALEQLRVLAEAKKAGTKVAVEMTKLESFARKFYEFGVEDTKEDLEAWRQAGMRCWPNAADDLMERMGMKQKGGEA